MRWSILWLVYILLLTPPMVSAQGQGNTKLESFNRSKRLLLQVVYRDRHTTFYCGAKFDKNKRIVENGSYRPLRPNARSGRIEWEHVVPAAEFGRTFKAWTNGDSRCRSSSSKPYRGRRCADKVSHKYRLMQSDLYNLRPAIGELNGLRSDSPYGIIPGEARRFGDCDFELEGSLAEPDPRIRGDIARTYWYMEWAYPGRVKLDQKRKALYKKWDQDDPVDDWERERSRRIELIQGNCNPFTK